MTLYEIKQDVLECLNNLQIDEETGEILNAEELDNLRATFDEKAENVALYIKNLVSDADAIKKEIDKLAERYRKAKSKADKLQKYLLRCLLETEKTSLTTAKVDVKLRKSQKVEFDDCFVEWAVQNGYDDFLNYAQPIPKKDEIKRAIKLGASFEHARIVENTNLSIK